MQKKEPKKNLLVEAAERKALAQASGDKPKILGKELSGRFFSSHAGQPQKPTKRGGRNGQGKP